MKIIYFNKNGISCSDYDIEETFSSLKEKEIINISNELLLLRFRLAYALKEIEKFKVILTDLDGSIIEEEITENFELHKILNSKIMSLTGYYLHKRLNLKKEKQLLKYVNTIFFTKTNEHISDYDIEDFFIKNKNNNYILINNEKILGRFELAVSEEEIKPFNLIVVDENDKITSELINTNGTFDYIYNAEILNKRFKYTADVWKKLAEKSRQPKLNLINKKIKKINIKVNDKRIFKTTDSSLIDLNNKECLVIEIIDGTKEEHLKEFDLEVLPMYKINLKDKEGNNIPCFSDELHVII